MPGPGSGVVGVHGGGGGAARGPAARGGTGRPDRGTGRGGLSDLALVPVRGRTAGGEPARDRPRESLAAEDVLARRRPGAAAGRGTPEHRGGSGRPGAGRL